MNVPTWVWLLTVVVTVALLLVDVAIIARRPHEPSHAEAGRHLAFYVGAAVLFGAGVWIFAGHDFGLQYYAGWLTEYSLSVDNLFIFIIIMSKFAVPRQYQQTALLVGIVMALIMRGTFIGLGAAAINQFSWVFYLFGSFLIYTAIKFAREGTSGEEDYHDSRVILWVERRLPATKDFDGVRLTVVRGGKRLITPMLVVILALGTTDLLFALDSIPAIYGLTKEPYLVFTANVFALMGLRQLYFLIGGLLQRLVYLGFGLSVLLAFIGVKLLLHALHENELPFVNGGEHLPVPEMSTLASLGAIVVILGVTTIASLARSRRDEAAADQAQPDQAQPDRATAGNPEPVPLAGPHRDEPRPGVQPEPDGEPQRSNRAR
jgi:tellurite resistance protein TerC